LRYLAAQVPEMLIAASASKNFGLYRERVGIALAVTAGGVARDAATGLLAHMNRLSFSFPPDHGARIVMHILQDDALRAMWQTELEQMRQRMAGNRVALAQALRAATGSDRFGFVAAQKGMFSILGITPAEVDILRDDHAIYVVEDGRMNLAGLTEASVPIVARAIAEVAS
jgi:aromatic-amino-acid transaminase